MPVLDGGEAIGDSPQQAVGLCLPVHLEPAMDAGDHEIECGQHLVRIVQRAVRQDIGLGPLQDPEVLSEFLVELGNENVREAASHHARASSPDEACITQ